MCGINGHAAASGERANLAAVAAMNAAMVHRGPDDGGALDLGFAAIGMRRLSIVDVERGRQPMTGERGAAIVYNGEVYDFGALRRELEAGGHRFRTRADTEVVLTLLCKHGPDALERLNGMFALAFADPREGSLLLARDPVGIKPLYYWVGARGELVFSSELASLVAHPAVPRRIDRRSLAMLLHDRYVADPWTLFDGVHQLEPGHALLWRGGKVSRRRFGGFRFDARPRDEREARAELEALLDQVVRSQMVADVPVGVFLSGGIDSSTVSAYAARALRERGERLKSFSIGFSRADHDESELASRVAAHLGTEHHVVRVADGGFEPSLLDRIVERVGQPLGDTSCIPTWIVSKLAREHVKVALSGDGGDEFFGGYDHMFWAARVRRLSRRAPRVVRSMAERVLARVAPIASGASGGLARVARRARKGLEVSLAAPEEQLRQMMALWTRGELAELLTEPALATDLRPVYRDSIDELAGLAPEEFAMCFLARTYMHGAILTKVDRMSMAASLEVRVPLLDRRVIEFAAALPLSLKVRGSTGKHLLREAGRALLPAELYDAPKRGFAVPLVEWFNDDFWQVAHEACGPRSRVRDLLEPRGLERVLADARGAGSREARLSSHAAATRLWLVVQLARWLERFEVAA